MADLGGKPAFAVGRREVTWHEVWEAARRSGSWKLLEREVGQGVALVRAGEEAPASEVRAEGEAFRRERGLHAGEDAEAWLTAREITIPEWRSHLARAVLRRLHPRVRPARVSGAREVDVTGWCSGTFDEMARDLAVARLGLGTVNISAKDLADLIERRRLDWIRINAEVGVFRNDDVAREAIQCVRADGMPLVDVARAAKGAATQWTGYLEELDAATRARMLAAAPGDVVGPIATERGSMIFLVGEKTLPSAKDREVLGRARAVLRESIVQRALEDRVVWHEPG